MPARSEHVLNLFYGEPEGDRWVPFDRYPRRIARRVWRGKPQPGGQRRVFLNLRAGLDRMGIHYRVNDYRWAREHPGDLICIIGKPHLLDAQPWQNPILFGSAVFSHPIDDPHLFERLPVRRVLVPGPWMKEMWKPYWDEPIAVWPVGIDTARWRPQNCCDKTIDVLLYDKVTRQHDHFEMSLIKPIRCALSASGRSVREIRYGYYREDDFYEALRQCRVMIFLCEHETQGIAYQQALACDVPILAWDPGGFWPDPSYFPDKVRYEPVTSVPYWDERCGVRFEAMDQFTEAWVTFWERVQASEFHPRRFILDNLTLETAAAQYVRHVEAVREQAAC